MRSRYSAFALGDVDWLLASWHPATRPPVLELDRSLRWTGLEVLEVAGGTVLQPDGVVAFRAGWTQDGRSGALEERSRFRRADGAWRYLDGT